MLKLVLKSLIFYRRSSVYQTAIVFILAAIITGSLLTGFSVRESLRTSADEHLGNTDVLISSGLRYFEVSLDEKIRLGTGEKCVSILETSGYCQNFTTGVTALNTKIYGITDKFFSFQGDDSIIVSPGAVVINQNLARQIGIDTGDDIIIHFKVVSPIPANAPFAQTSTSDGIKVFKVSQILNQQQSGNFSLGISQIVPSNIFMNLSDLTADGHNHQKANRLLIENSKNISSATLRNILKQGLTPSDIGLSIRKTETNGGSEIISERIFIDQEIIDQIVGIVPAAKPVITYLANNISKKGKSTPYSFVSGLPSSIYPEISTGNNIIINNWLAEDLDAKVNDTVSMQWYTPSANGKLEETGNKFTISRIVRMESIWSDPSLMPEFPGIAGTSSCSEWDAGVPLNMKLIRKKDEAYWNNFKGTPKAFLSYEKAKELWGSNFGPATSIRFPGAMTPPEAETALAGSINPEKSGFSINYVRADAINSANDSVDFSTLFLSLGFFIIMSCIILLALSVNFFFDSRKEQVFTFFALGFTNSRIRKLLVYETFAIALAGAFPGVLAGGLINWLIIAALNSVWSGAVQTNTIVAHLSVLPLFTGFFITIFICLILLNIKTGRFLNALRRSEKGTYAGHSKRKNFIFLLISIFIVVLLLVFSFIFKELSVSLSFVGGVAVFIVFVLLVRFYFIGGFSGNAKNFTNRNSLPRLFYFFSPSHAVTPVIIIAAGIFAVFITGVNRLNISDEMSEPSGGTGGFMLWCEAAIPVREDLNNIPGRKEFGLDDENIRSISFVQAKKTQGDDASCLNLNHVTVPPLLGLDPSMFTDKGSFSFASSIKALKNDNIWEVIKRPPENNTVFGVADQTVLQWGLRISPGDTIKLKSESGQVLNVVIAAGLKSSVFQGFVIIGLDNFERYFPSVPGSSVFLVDGDPSQITTYRSILQERFSNHGITVVPASERLASFFEVTNTYLSVFTILGAFGMILGVAGLGFILLRNYNQRKKEFALMSATGFSVRTLRRMLFRDQFYILSAGIGTGVISAIIATLPSILSGSEIPWVFLITMIGSVFLIGFTALRLSVRAIRNESLVASLRKE